MESITSRLFEMQDLKYKDFQSKLMPSVSRDCIIGVRTPPLRALAKEIWKSGEYKSFISELPHKYYEENNLHAFLIEKIKDYDLCVRELERFLPFVDNWATCDSMSPKIFRTHKEELYSQIKLWLLSEHTYTVRFAIKTLLSLYSGEDFLPEYILLVASVKSHEYYVNMAISWYFATVLAYHYDEAIKIIEAHALEKWTHNKAIQKAVESYKIDEEQKIYLKTLRIV